MCISLHYFFVATGHELKKLKKGKVMINYLAGIIPYVQTTHAHGE